MRGITPVILFFFAVVASSPLVAGAAQPNRASPDTVDVSALGAPEPAAAMALESGRQGVQIDRIDALLNTNESTGYVGSNYLQSAATGTNTISDNAFGNASGIATVIQNSGNQVLIQNSMIVNLTTR